MAITNFAAYKSIRDNPSQRWRFERGSTGIISGRAGHTWSGSTNESGTPAAPTAAVVPTSATAGAPGLKNGTLQRILKVVLEAPTTGGSGGLVTVCDRLSHQGGLSGTATGAQTTNLPTAALTRHTGGVGVMAGLDIYSQLGASVTTITASYTNTTPTAARTTEATTWGGTAFREANRRIILSLQNGDVGLVSVENVNAVATTSTAGNFGVTLFYPLISMPLDISDRLGTEAEALFDMGCWFPRYDDNACLEFMYHLNGLTTGTVMGVFTVSEDL